MDIASRPWLNPIMRFGFLALCGLAALPSLGWGQTASPSITLHPSGASAYVGDSVTLTGGADGDAPLAFQWYKGGTAVGGATGTTFTVAPLALTDTAVYYFIATNPYGTATSLPTAIYVTKRPQTLSLAPTVTTAIAGSSIVLSATSSSNLPVSLTLVSGAASLNGNILTGSGGSVVVRATQAGNDSFAAAEALDRTYTFTSGSLSPFITSPPPDQTVTAGTGVTFRAAAIGTPAPTYQWQKDGSAIAGATTATLALATTTLADSGRYTVTVTNPAGSATASATLTVRAAPTITSAPVSQTVLAGESVRFSVDVTGFPTPTFQWRRNGTALTGATNATLALASVTTASAGRYEVIATNALGTATSPAATLTVTSRDFSGTYFGRFAGATGDFALHVRADRSAVFLGSLPGLQTGLAALALSVELNGTFALNTVTLASAPDVAATTATPVPAAAPQPISLRGALNAETGAVSGTVAELNATFDGSRIAATGPSAALAGVYRAALVGSASGRGDAIVAADGQALLLTAIGTTLDAARGTLDGTGRLLVTTSSQAALDLRFSAGTLNGTVRTAAGVTGTIAGAVEAQLGTEHIVNLSVRSTTSPAANLITGFVIAGTAPKQVLIRAAGPALVPAPFNVANALADPTLQLYRGNQIIGQNDDWDTPAANAAAITAAATRAGAFPFRAGSADAAILTTLQPGPYSVVVGGGNGTTLAEVYEVLANNEAPGVRRLVNVSSRGLVTPASPLIAGFVITGPAPQRLLIRGIGPTLGTPPFNVAGALPNPQLTLFRGATPVRTNDDWFRDAEAALIRAAATQSGAFALGPNSLDAALLVYLEPGAYTVQVTGPANANQANSTGLALIEIYEAAP
ncbi:immunoglobulin domain-containing protein [Horticoccus sp. 23ND18S-11]|uniref:immunoglobulin domain-containing protein n=1 Tax=Horticoccus sp. 23ND18S-11 TaxID=3391832 RepID=UPI0039C97366